MQRKEAKDKVELARITLERCVALMRNEKGKMFEIVRYKTICLLNYFEKISKYLDQRTKVTRSKRPSLKALRSVKNDHSVMKSKDGFRCLDGDFELSSMEEDKFESIDLRNSKVLDSSLTEENKLDNLRDQLEDYDKNEPRSAFDVQPDKIDHSYFRTTEDPQPDVKGHLLCIRCGHNGNFSIQEKALYEKYLADAGFITLTSNMS